MYENKFLWKSAEKGNGNSFWLFLTQLRQHYQEEKVAVIADNVSFHKCAYIKEKVNNYKNVGLFNLPSYSPEYNPVEQIWHWAKPIVHGTPVLHGGAKELITRFRKTIYHWRTGRMCKPLQVGHGIWNALL